MQEAGLVLSRLAKVPFFSMMSSVREWNQPSLSVAMTLQLIITVDIQRTLLCFAYQTWVK